MFGKMRISQELLAFTGVGLSLSDVFLFGDLIAFVNHFFRKFGIGRESHIVLLNGSIGQNDLTLDFWAMKRNRVKEDFFNSFFPYSLTEVYQVAGIAGKTMPEMCFSTKKLHVGVHYPGFSECLIAQIIEPFEQLAPDHKAYVMSWLACGRVQVLKLFFKILPVNLPSQQHQFVTVIDEIGEQRLKKIALFLIRRFSNHYLQGFTPKIRFYLQISGYKNVLFYTFYS